MRTTHFGHSCVLLDTGAARLLIDPGTFASGFEGLTGLDAVLVTHQHPDHLDVERLLPLLRANPDARLLVDAGSAGSLAVDHPAVDHSVLAPGDALDVAGAQVRVLGSGDHAVVHPDLPVVPNNAYLVDGTHLHPGDAFPDVDGPVEVLFLPTAAAWLKASEAVDHLRAVAPRTAVPVHQGLLAHPHLFYGLYADLAPDGTEVRVLDAGEAVDL